MDKMAEEYTQSIIDMNKEHKYLTDEQLWILRQLNSDKVVIRLLDEIQAYKEGKEG